MKEVGAENNMKHISINKNIMKGEKAFD